MNAVLMNRDGFQVPADGFYQIAPLGEFGHAQAGLVQVVDAEACAAMVNRFTEDAKLPNFAGLLVDFDHFSLDGEKKSEAAGWITALENRDGGLFAKIRWSDVGDAAVKGGRYRFLSPVWARGDCADLGNGRVRPMRLLNAAVTNDPNLKGMQPLSNSGQSSEVSGQGEKTSTATDAKGREGGEQRLKWMLGASDKGHCPSCAAMDGKVHTQAEWDKSGVTPGCGALLCRGNCHCSLVPTDDPSGGDVVPGPLRELTNTGWTDAARAASLAVRQARAVGRSRSSRYSSSPPAAKNPRYAGKPSGSAQGETSGADDKASGGKSGGAAEQAQAEQDAKDAAEQAAHEKAADEAEHQDQPPAADDAAEQAAHEKAADEAEHQDKSDDEAEQGAHEKAADEAEHQDTPDEGDDAAGKSGDERAVDRAAQIAEEAKTDAAGAFQRSGLSGMTDEQKQALSDSIGQKVRDGEPLSSADSDFVKAGGLTPSGGSTDTPAQNVDEPLPPPAISPGDNKAMTPPQTAPKADQPARGGRGGSTGKQVATNDQLQAKYAKVGLGGLTPSETKTLNDMVVEKVRNGVSLNPTETAFVKEYYGK